MSVQTNADNSFPSNPNLLINPDFKINQRGVTSWTGSNIGVDCWKSWNQLAYVQDDGIKIVAGTTENPTSGCIEQYVEGIKEGSVITFSASVNGIVYSCTGKVIFDSGYCVAGYHGDILNMDIITRKCKVVIPRIWLHNLGEQSVVEGTSVVVNWAKLEYGNHATLFVPPNPTLEFMKCQRYYQLYFGPDLEAFTRYSDTLLFRGRMKTPMYSNPTMSLLKTEVHAYDTVNNKPYLSSCSVIVAYNIYNLNQNQSVHYIHVNGFTDFTTMGVPVSIDDADPLFALTSDIVLTD